MLMREYPPRSGHIGRIRALDMGCVSLESMKERGKSFIIAKTVAIQEDIA
jgi:hypothetical protein